MPLGALNGVFSGPITLMGFPGGFLKLCGRGALGNDSVNDKFDCWFLIISYANGTICVTEFIDTVDEERYGHISFR